MGSPLRYKDRHFEAIPNRALDLIESSKVKDSWNMDLMNISQLMTFDRAVMTYKIVILLCPAGLENKFIERSVISNIIQGIRGISMCKN